MRVVKASRVLRRADVSTDVAALLAFATKADVVEIVADLAARLADASAMISFATSKEAKVHVLIRGALEARRARRRGVRRMATAEAEAVAAGEEVGR